MFKGKLIVSAIQFDGISLCRSCSGVARVNNSRDFGNCCSFRSSDIKNEGEFLVSLITILTRNSFANIQNCIFGSERLRRDSIFGINILKSATIKSGIPEVFRSFFRGNNCSLFFSGLAVFGYDDIVDGSSRSIVNNININIILLLGISPFEVVTSCRILRFFNFEVIDTSSGERAKCISDIDRIGNRVSVAFVSCLSHLIGINGKSAFIDKCSSSVSSSGGGGRIVGVRGEVERECDILRLCLTISES